MRNPRTDHNQTAIVDAFRTAGSSVTITSGVHGGFPDIVVGTKGLTIVGDITEEVREYLQAQGLRVIDNANLLVEIKNGPKEPLTPAQVIWHDNHKGSVIIIRAVEEVKKLIGE